ncbi:uncharacterized protein LY79DRAFT_570247 [Colletotrichum navitas]|uniref:Uncharacterized protein n=1 Tax=Colletotrichum navitas TaxID=681940 RepID=A0AAD8PMR2_9PEZI|nr:uncharacterized protein LY79DRAFT_570247 [Colletotrichum navitas]KAK1570160.1 hypothetical protein LY79DRAFT_570247 [Colletotrichum navitas]
MKLSLLIAAVYAVANVQATCYCYDWTVSNRPPYKTIPVRDNEATRYACQHWGYDPVSGNGGLVCNSATSLSLANWRAACSKYGARGGVC